MTSRMPQRFIAVSRGAYNPESFEPVAQRVGMQAELGGCAIRAFDHPAAAVQRARVLLARSLAAGARDRRCDPARYDRIDREHVAWTDDHRALDRVLELAHVA